jgi:aminopeptidase-like protein
MTSHAPAPQPETWDLTVDPAIGEAMHAFMAELYPICRSITGDGVRETMRRISAHIPLVPHDVPTGTPAFDWTVPEEWNIRDGWVKNASGEKIVDFQRSNLHVLNYSIPVHKKVSLAELKEHLFSIPEHPEWTPHRTSYYTENWGFCLPHRQLLALEDGEYEVFIDATLAPGSLTYGECYLPGETEEEALISTHTCHPSLCNDNLSGIAVATFLAKRIAALKRRYSYRFVFAPTTIGSIVWLSRNERNVHNIRHGLVITCVGDPGEFTYKKSRCGAEIDRAVEIVMKHGGDDYKKLEFHPFGYDERQYCSPGFNLPVGLFMRTQHGKFPEYHTSADNLDFVKPDALAKSYERVLAVLHVLESNGTYVNLKPKCEPQLGRRGLFRAIGGHGAPGMDTALLWVLNFSDGDHSLLDIAERSNLPFERIKSAADLLAVHGLLRGRQLKGHQS